MLWIKIEMWERRIVSFLLAVAEIAVISAFLFSVMVWGILLFGG